MKKFKYTTGAAAVLLAATIASCNKLDEYNPGGSTADATWSTPQGFVTAVNAAYWDQRNWYGKEDGIWMSEAGTDLWINQNNVSYNDVLTRYVGLGGNVGTVKNDWKAFWRSINQCNAGIGRIDKAGFTDLNEKNKRLAELRFMRAFYYWHVVETWGNVMLRTTETDSVTLSATRAPIKDFYDLIVSDLEFAKDNLPNDWGAEYSRATKKSALGLLARACLTRAYYPDADATYWFTKARDAAKQVIDRQTEFNVSLWANPADLWDPKNNKKNKESLYTISNSATSITSDYDANGNRDHLYFLAKYSANRVALQLSFDYGYDNFQYLMPTRYLLDLFDETKDARYEASFQEKWYNNTGTTFTWTAANYKSTFWTKDATVAGKTIAPNELALNITKGTLTDKSTSANLAFDRNDIYDAATGKAKKQALATFPSLRKFMCPTRPTIDKQPGFNDIFVIRLAEMYMIAGEAEYKLGNAATAATYFNVIRKRAAKSGVDYSIDPSVITPDWILEERAREFCGEHIRWFDLKRMKRGDDWANWIKAKNPDITAVTKDYWVRPISLDELNALTGSPDFGQNPGYAQ